MQDIAHCRAMESLCRQVAAFRPLENWRLLAEAEMWHHRALQEIALQQTKNDGAPLSSGSDRAVPKSSSHEGSKAA